MKRIAGVLLFLFFLAGSSYSSFPAVNDVQISGDITTQAVSRDLSLGLRGLLYGGAGNTKDTESFFLFQIRLGFQADLSDNVEANVRLLNERLWGAESNSNSDIDLDLAYLKVKDFLTLPLTVTVGRQNLRFGNAFIIGDPDTNLEVSSSSALYHIADDLSLRKSFDAVRGTFDFDPLVIDLIYATVQESSTNVDDDIALYGFNANYSPNEHSTYELYLFAKDNDSANEDDNNQIYCGGAHLKKDLTNKLTLNFEAAHQFGEYRDDTTATVVHAKRDAWAGQLGLDYKFLNKAYSMIGGWFTYLSGDGSSTTAPGRTYSGWDPMFEDQTGGEIINLILPHTNSYTLKAYFFTYLQKKLNFLLSYTSTFLAQHHYSTRYPIADGPAYLNYYYTEPNHRHLADEVDCKFTYDYSENTQFVLDTGIVMPGGLLASENNNTGYSLRLSAKVTF